MIGSPSSSQHRLTVGGNACWEIKITLPPSRTELLCSAVSCIYIYVTVENSEKVTNHYLQVKFLNNQHFIIKSPTSRSPLTFNLRCRTFSPPFTMD